MTHTQLREINNASARPKRLYPACSLHHRVGIAGDAFVSLPRQESARGEQYGASSPFPSRIHYAKKEKDAGGTVITSLKQGYGE